MLLCAAGSNPVHRSECYLDYVAVPVGGNFPCHLTRRIAFGCRDYATGPSIDEKVGAAGEATGCLSPCPLELRGAFGGSQARRRNAQLAVDKDEASRSAQRGPKATPRQITLVQQGSFAVRTNSCSKSGLKRPPNLQWDESVKRPVAPAWLFPTPRAPSISRASAARRRRGC